MDYSVVDIFPEKCSFCRVVVGQHAYRRLFLDRGMRLINRRTNYPTLACVRCTNFVWVRFGKTYNYNIETVERHDPRPTHAAHETSAQNQVRSVFSNHFLIF